MDGVFKIVRLEDMERIAWPLEGIYRGLLKRNFVVGWEKRSSSSWTAIFVCKIMKNITDYRAIEQKDDSRRRSKAKITKEKVEKEIWLQLDSVYF